MNRARLLTVLVLAVLAVYAVLHPYVDPRICYGFALHGTYHYFPVPCGTWPLYN